MSSRYLHGTSSREQRRLALLNDLLNEEALAHMRLRGGERVLDLGCGLAQLTRAMARAAGPAGRVVGIERSAEQIAAALRLARAAGEEDRIELRQGDVLTPPLGEAEWGSFDLAHARFVLEHVADPAAVVHAMARAVRPGGRIILEDDDHDVLRLWPEPPGARELWQAYVLAFEHNGNDPYVGRRLVELLHEAGAQPVRNTWLFFGGCAGMKSFPVLVDNLIGLLRSARGRMLEEGSLAPDTYERGLEALGEWGRRPDAAMWFPVSWAEGRRPVHG